MSRNNNDSYILVLGASIIDIIGFSKCKYKSCDSIPGNIKMSFGGVCRNIAENLARVGVNTEFISVVGQDEMGQRMLDHSKTMGYNMENSLILEDGSTPTYMAVLNEHGEMVSAVVDMDSLDRVTTEFIDSKAHIIENAEYTCLDSDNPAIMEYLLTKFRGKTKFILDPVSSTKAKNVKHLVKYFHTVKPNRLEAEALTGIKIENYEDINKAADYFLNLGVEKVFISLDEDGIFYKDKAECGRVKALEVDVVNVNGAGDSFVGGIGYGYMKNLSMEDTVKYAVTMSTITISHEDTIHPEMSKEFVDKKLNEIKWHEF